MDTHHIHGEKIGIHGEASDARHWLEHGMTKDGLESLAKQAQSSGEAHFFNDEGKRFKLVPGKDGLEVHRSHHH